MCSSLELGLVGLELGLKLFFPFNFELACHVWCGSFTYILGSLGGLVFQKALRWLQPDLKTPGLSFKTKEESLEV